MRNFPPAAPPRPKVHQEPTLAPTKPLTDQESYKYIFSRHPLRKVNSHVLNSDNHKNILLKLQTSKLNTSSRENNAESYTRLF